MKNKLIILMLLCAVLVALVPVSEAKAETTEEWHNFGEYWLAQGYSMEDLPFEYDQNKKYVFAKEYTGSSYYFILVFDEGTDVSAMYQNGGSIHPRGTYEFAYKGLIGAWEGVTNSSFTLYQSNVANVLYTDFCIPNSGGGSCSIHRTATGEDVSFEFALADMTDDLKEILQGYSYYVVAKVPYRVNDYRSEQIMIAVSNSSKVVFRNEAYNQIWFTTGSGKEAGKTYSYHSECCFWSCESSSYGYITGDSVASGGEVPEILWTNCDIYYEDGNTYAPTDEVWWEAYPYGGEIEEEPTVEIITDGFPRLFEVSDSYTCVYEGLDVSSLVSIVVTNGKSGIVYGVEYDGNGIAWYDVSVLHNSVNYRGYVKAGSVAVGASLPSTGTAEPTPEPTPVPTIPPVDVPSDETIAEQIEKLTETFKAFVSLIGVVPMMIGAVFGFLPSWAIGVVAISFSFMGVYLVIKVIRG